MSRFASVSDLHLFARRSHAERHLDRIHAAARDADRFVLVGDIVDFRWSRHGSADATADAALEWAEALLGASGDGDVHYVLGNHDHAPALVERLEDLASRHARFHWEPYHLRLGDTVFLHGDVANPRMDHARLEAYRARFADHSPPRRGAQTAYDVAVALRLQAMGASLMYRHATVLRRIARYLDEIGIDGDGDRATDVVFGHTHRAIDGALHGGRRFHNGGAPIGDLDFRVVEGELR